MEYLDGKVCDVVFRKKRADNGLLAHKHDGHAQLRGCLHGSLDFHTWSVVAAHGINGDFNHRGQTGDSLLFSDFENFAIFVITAVRAGAMG
jgi:hypothetical protein